ncbi:probable maleylacetoacetate isomerase 1 [Choristoneura fumiferana]|uniref:probable maleylacetoacetate isomerase 1 n=1 Tax=Choristoneura fumiferana TaxID=7141 RepID=UPI003D1581CA
MPGGNRVILYAYWASSCSWRVRAALQAKHIPFEEQGIDIIKEMQQLTESYRNINPAQKVPALVIDDVTIVESMAIIQYLEETRPQPSLLPDTPLLRARMREVVETVVSGIQPLQVPNIKAYFATDAEYTKFTHDFIIKGLKTLEALLSNTAGKFCIGDQLTMADVCLVPQLYNAFERHKVPADAAAYPTVLKLYASLLNEKVFASTHPVQVKADQRRTSLEVQ